MRINTLTMACSWSKHISNIASSCLRDRSLMMGRGGGGWLQNGKILRPPPPQGKTCFAPPPPSPPFSMAKAFPNALLVGVTLDLTPSPLPFCSLGLPVFNDRCLRKGAIPQGIHIIIGNEKIPLYERKYGLLYMVLII